LKRTRHVRERMDVVLGIINIKKARLI